MSFFSIHNIIQRSRSTTLTIQSIKQSIHKYQVSSIRTTLTPFKSSSSSSSSSLSSVTLLPSPSSVQLNNYHPRASNFSTLLAERRNYIMCQKNNDKCCSSSSCSSGSTSRSSSSSSSAASSATPAIIDIEDIHTEALRAKSNTYIDPPTGFTVFTEYIHLKRGKCCGNVCRHCPYGWENVSYKQNGKTVRRKAKVQSGDKEGVKVLLDKIEAGDIVGGSSLSADISASSSVDSSIVSIASEEEEESQANDTHNVTPKKKKTYIKRATGKGGRNGGTLTAKNVPYTRTGDEGTSMLLSGERRSKDDDSFEAMGTVDELCSVVGVVHAQLVASLEADQQQDQERIDYGDLSDWLIDTMSRLFDVGSHIAKPKRKFKRNDDDSDSDSDDDDSDDEVVFVADGVGGGFDADHIVILEEWVDIMTEQLPELNSFVLPTGGMASAQLHVARTVCRRAERRVLTLVKDGVCDPNALRYLNRLSDFLFTAARWTNFCEGKEEVQYRRYYQGAKQRGVVTVNLRDEKKVP